MIEDIKIAYYQKDIAWGNRQSNYDDVEKEMAKIKDEEVDLLILPEVFATGFCSKNIYDFSESEYGETFEWMQQLSKNYNTVVLGSCFVKNTNGNIYNTLYMVYPSGNFDIYNKRHLFRLGAEYKELSSGVATESFLVKGWKIAPYICYDLRFPAWMRNSFVSPSDFKYDICVVVANWPSKRMDAWKKLLEARAIENMSYVVGVNRVGKDPDGISYSGESRVIDYKGNVISSIDPNEAKLSVTSLSYQKLKYFRECMPFYLDWDRIEINDSYNKSDR